MSILFPKVPPHIRNKLQKLEIDRDTPSSLLVEVAYWVFNNSDIEEGNSEDERAWRQSHLLAVALQHQLISTRT